MQPAYVVVKAVVVHVTYSHSIHTGSEKLSCLYLTKVHHLTWPDPGSKDRVCWVILARDDLFKEPRP